MHPLDAIEVRSPCTQPWSSMRGDDRVRFCGHCRKDVYDLSNMTREEATAFVRDRDEACVRFRRRADGTVATSDCRRALGPVATGALAGAVLVTLGAVAVHATHPNGFHPSHFKAMHHLAKERTRAALRGTPLERVLVQAGLIEEEHFLGALFVP